MKHERIALKQLTYFNNASFDFDCKSQNYKKKNINLATEAYEICQHVDKQNQSLECDKKIKLKLKTIASREFERKPEIKLLISQQKQKIEKSEDDNYGLKVYNRKGLNKSNPEGKKTKIGTKFKPNLVYFQLKSLRQSVKQKIQVKIGHDEAKSQQLKQRSKIKNYQLSSFLSQVLSKLAQLYPSIFNHQITLKLLSSRDICYSELIEILYSLGMASCCSQEKYKIESEDQKNELQKIYLLWKVLKLNQIQIQQQSPSAANINVLNVIVILTVIHNISFYSLDQLIQMIIEKIQQVSTKQIKLQQNPQSKVKRLEEPNNIFLIRNKKIFKQFEISQFQDILILNPNQQIKTQIIKEFELFRVNRLKIQNHTKPAKQNLQIQIKNSYETIQSLLSPKSQQLAMTRRLKILEEIHNSAENYMTKETIQQLELNFFLNYKKPQNFDHEKKSYVSKELFKKQQKKQTEKKDSKQLNMVVNKNKYIQSQKIKFCELNVVQNMQKARRMKLEKQLILEKGWTNSGQISSRSSKLNSAQQKQSNKRVPQGARSLYQSKSLSKAQQKRGNLLQNRKNSMQVVGKNEQLLLNSYNPAFEQKNSNFKDKNYEKDQQLFEEDQDQNNTVIRHESDEDSNDTNSIDKLEPIELQNRNLTHEDDFLIEDDESFQKLNESLKICTNVDKNDCEQQNPYEPQSSSKTFRIEFDEENEPQKSVSIAKKHGLQNRPSQQTRVIKSYIKIPILYVDVNMDESKKERIIIYEEDNPTNLAQEFGKKHGLDSVMVGRLQQMLKEQISGILGRIDEEEQDDYEEANDNILTEQEKDTQDQKESDN